MTPTVAVTASPAATVTFREVAAPELSIVIVTFGTGRILDECIARLAAALRADDLAAEVVVVDNPHPRRGTWAGDRLRIGTAGLRIVRSTRNLGFAGGNNVGVAVARADRLCLLNPDVLLSPGQLSRLVAASIRWPDDIVAPALYWPDGRLQELGYRVLADGETRAVLDGSHDADYSSAACWVLSRPMFERVGGFDEGYHPAYYEDVDFTFRARALGSRTRVVADVHVTHAVRSGVGDATPDVRSQRQRFVERWGHLLVGRPTA